MKKIIFLKGMLSVVMLFIASLTISAAKPGDNLVHNTEEVNGVIISETVFKMDGNMLTNYMKHNYKYDTNQQRTEDESQKWNLPGRPSTSSMEPFGKTPAVIATA